MNALDAQFIKRIRIKVRAFLAKGKYRDWEDDLVQEVILHFYSHGKHQLIEHAVIEVARKFFGNPRTKKGAARSAKHVGDKALIHLIVEQAQDPLEWKERLKILDPFERMIVNLIFIWEFNQAELAQLCGVSEAWMSREVKTLLNELKDDLISE